MTIKKHATRRERPHNVGITYLAVLVAVLAMIPTWLLIFPARTSSAAGSSVPITGWAWSETIGWISLNCATGGSTGNDICGSGPGQSNYGMSVNTTNGNISGYGWSENIGWVSANESGCPPASVLPCQPNIDSGTGKLTGWFRALAGNSPPINATNGGWDGWISLSCDNTGTCGSGPGQSDYGVRVTAGSMVGWGWGSDVVGWLDFHGSVAFPLPIPTPPVLTGTFTASPKVVKNGGHSTLAWNVPNATACSYTDLDTDVSGPLSVPSGSKASAAITARTTYYMTCSASGYSDFNSTVTISLAPIYKEN